MRKYNEFLQFFFCGHINMYTSWCFANLKRLRFHAFYFVFNLNNIYLLFFKQYDSKCFDLVSLFFVVGGGLSLSDKPDRLANEKFTNKWSNANNFCEYVYMVPFGISRKRNEWSDKNTAFAKQNKERQASKQKKRKRRAMSLLSNLSRASH